MSENDSAGISSFDQRRARAFEDLLIAAMKDAAIEGKLTQFKTTITPEETGRETFIRIVIMPEAMMVERPEGFQKP